MRPEPGEVHLISTRLTSESGFTDRLRHLLDGQELARADRFHFEKDRNSFTIARGLLRVILGSYVQTSPSAIQFTYGPHGKPALIAARAIRFNLSHSGDRVLYAVSGDYDVGADVEYIRPIQDLEDIARRFFCPAEYRELLGLPEEQRLKGFFDCWTRKEAFIKAVGEGLSYPLNHFQVTLRAGDAPRFVSICGQDAEALQWSLHDLAPSEDYAAALAVPSRNCRVRISKFETPAECARACMWRS